MTPKAVEGARPAARTVPPSIREAVEQVAAQQSLPAPLIHSVIQVESNYDPLAVSPKGALGLMQLIPATAKRFGVNNVFDPVENIEGGAKYLKYLLSLYNDDLSLALAAYNAGEANVAKYGGLPPFTETRNYVDRVGKHLAAHKTAQSKPRQPEKQAEPGGPNHIQEVVDAGGAVRYVTR